MIFKILLPLYLSLASRFHGGGFIQDVPRPIRAGVFALPYFLFGWPAFVLAFIGKNIAHEDFWNMGVRPSRPDESWLCTLILLATPLRRDSLAFCTAGLAIKGIITAAGTLSPAIILAHAVALPLAYYIGQRTRWGNELAEYLSGAFYGISILILA